MPCTYASGMRRLTTYGAVWGITWCVAVAVVLIGSDSAGASFVALLHRAAETTLAKRSALVQFDISLSAPGQGSYPLIETTGREKFSTPAKAAFTVTIHASAGKGTQQVQEVQDGTTLYVKAKGTWYRTTTQEVQGTLGVSDSISDPNPTAILAFVYQEGATVKNLGRTTLDGSAMTEYRATISLANASPGSGKEVTLTPQAINEFEQLSGSTSATVDVWIDSAGAVRQEHLTVPLSAAALDKMMGISDAPQGIDENVTVTFSDFGIPVRATPPASSKPLPTTNGGSSSVGGSI